MIVGVTYTLFKPWHFMTRPTGFYNPCTFIISTNFIGNNLGLGFQYLTIAMTYAKGFIREFSFCCKIIMPQPSLMNMYR